jgi:CheY-like chemotaxis protein
MDGRELLKRTRQLFGAAAPPFVFLTGLALLNLRTSCDLREQAV